MKNFNYDVALERIDAMYNSGELGSGEYATYVQTVHWLDSARISPEQASVTMEYLMWCMDAGSRYVRYVQRALDLLEEMMETA